MQNHPFNEDWVKNFFIIKDSILQQDESMTIEFKGTFDWETKEARSKYAKTSAAFANNRGGYLIFGIDNKTHQLTTVENFIDVTDAQVATFLNNHFIPHIEFESKLFDLGGYKIGVFYFYESTKKPIICYRDTEATSVSDIYYRYEEQSEKIKPGELLRIIDDVRQQESNKWAQIIQNIAKIGIDNVGLLNTIDGMIKSKNNKFILDERLLKQVKIVDRYSEKDDGAPALKIIGEIPEVGRVITQAKAIFEGDIINAFISQDTQGSPDNFLKAVLHQNSEIYPIYFFINELKLSHSEAIDFISTTKARTATSDGVIRRLKKEGKLAIKGRFYPFTDTPAGKLRQKYYDDIQHENQIVFENIDQIQRFLETLFSLKKGEFNIKYLLIIINEIFTNYYPFDKSGLNHIFRWSISYIDFIHFRRE